jgi:Zn-dependent M32 family carboxypeptidase
MMEKNEECETDSLVDDMDTTLTYEQLKQLISTLRHEFPPLVNNHSNPISHSQTESTNSLRPPSHSNSAQSSPVLQRHKVSPSQSTTNGQCISNITNDSLLQSCFEFQQTATPSNE